MTTKIYFDKPHFIAQELADALQAQFPELKLWPYSGEITKKQLDARPYVEVDSIGIDGDGLPLEISDEVAGLILAFVNGHTSKSASEAEYQEQKEVEKFDRILAKSTLFKKLEADVIKVTPSNDK